MPPEIESEEWTTVTTLWTAAGWVKAAYDFIEFLYEFGKTDPIEYALQRIERELEDIRNRLDVLETRVDEITLRLVAEENKNRIRLVNEQVKDLQTIAFQLGNAPTDRVRAAEAAHTAGNIADVFLDDLDLWNWSDVVTITPRNQWGEPDGETRVEPAPPDFKLAVAYPAYTLALTTWIAAILLHTGGDAAEVGNTYGEKLDRHIRAVSVRHEWRDNGSTTETVAERIRERIRCEPHPNAKYAENGICTFGVVCKNTIERSSTVVRTFDVQMDGAGPTVLCTVDPNVVLQDEQELEDQYPAIAGLNTLNEILRSVRSTGHMPAEQFIGQFPNWTAAWISMFGIMDEGTMHRYHQKYTPGPEGWVGPETVATEWPYDVTLSAGGDSMFALGALARWKYYPTANSQPQELGLAMEMPFRFGGGNVDDIVRLSPTWSFFGSGTGVMYGVVTGNANAEYSVGDLYWTRTEGDPSRLSFSDIRKVGWGWNVFTTVFSVGDGVIYGILPNGDLRWYHHTAWWNGNFEWEDPRDLNTGIDWRRFPHVIGADDGFIFGVYPNGRMVGYRHLDWKTGGTRFEGPYDAGSGWTRYRLLFAGLPVPLGGIH